MDDKTRKVVDRMKETFVELAQTQAVVAIGEVTLALIERGDPITADSLVAELQRRTAAQRSTLVQAQNEAAEKAIRAAQTKTQS